MPRRALPALPFTRQRPTRRLRPGDHLAAAATLAAMASPLLHQCQVTVEWLPPTPETHAADGSPWPHVRHRLRAQYLACHPRILTLRASPGRPASVGEVLAAACADPATAPFMRTVGFPVDELTALAARL